MTRCILPRLRRAAHHLPLAALLIGALARPVAAQPAPGGPPSAPPAVFPDSPLGRLGRTLLELVNAGDSAAIARFVTDRVDQDPRGRSPAAIAGMLRALHVRSGGLVLEGVQPMGGTLRVFTRARAVDRVLGIELEGAPGRADRLASIALHPMDPAMMQRPVPLEAASLDDAAIAAAVRAHVRRAGADDRFAGVVLVARGDRVLVHEAVGMADAARGVPNTTATRFPIFSVGKLFTGVAVAQLAAAGRLALDSSLAAALPAYPNREAAARVTLRQLLTHTAGLPEPFHSPRFHGAARDASHAALLATFADAPLEQEPGSGFRYGNGNYVALAAVVERVSGRSFAEYLDEHVWRAAGVTRAVNAAGDTATAVGYGRFTTRDPLALDPLTAAPGDDAGTRQPARGFGGGAYTAEELFRVARALRAGRLLPAAWVDSMATGRVALAPGMPVRYGFGLYDREMGGARIVGHPGSNSDTGYDADVQMVWDGEWTVVVLANRDAPAGMRVEMPILLLLARQTAEGRAATAPAGTAAGAR